MKGRIVKEWEKNPVGKMRDGFTTVRLQTLES